MHRFPALLHRFAKDERGVFAVMFGLMAIVLIATGGAVVDYVSLEQTRSRAQIALDAAALALQPEIFDTKVTKAVIQQRAQALMVERIGDASVKATVTDAVIDVENGSLLLHAEMTMPTVFVRLVGVDTLTANILSEAMRKKLELEVVMVLDNSGSMDDKYQNRMTSLVNAAKTATEILYAGMKPTDTNVKLGIVPFTQFVNVGADNANQPWINRSGNNAIVRDNFDNDSDPKTGFTTTSPSFDRIALFSQLKGTYKWGGCVEARQYPYDTDNTLPTTAETKFVPLFAPDEPDTPAYKDAYGRDVYFNNNYVSDTPETCSAPPSCTWVRTLTGCNFNYSSCNGPKTDNYTYRAPNGLTTASTASCIGDGVQSGATVSERSSSGNNYTLKETRYYVFPRVMQERICKYNGATVTQASRSQATGPNLDCPVHPIVPLTNNQTTVLAAIEKMRPSGRTNQPEGGTNIAQGAVWGFHLLSPGEPFAQAAEAGTQLKKVMILMTDGDNFASPSASMNGSTFFGAYGFPYNNTTRSNAGRLGGLGWSESQLRTEMDNRTLATCANAKAQGIEIYTIGLYSSTASTIQMLQNCSSGASDHYYPATAANLNAVFQSIARQLQPLRINQ